MQRFWRQSEGTPASLCGKKSEHGRAETNKHVGAQTGGAMFELALQTDETTENRRQDERVSELPTIPLAISPRSKSTKCCQFMKSCACSKQASDGRILSSRLAWPSVTS